MKKILVFVVMAMIIYGCQKSVPEKKTKTEVKDDIVSFVAVGDNLMHQRLLDEAKTEDMIFHLTIQISNPILNRLIWLLSIRKQS